VGLLAQVVVGCESSGHAHGRIVMPNDHKQMKQKIEKKYGAKNVVWGDEVSDLGAVTAGLAAYFGVQAGYEYFARKLDNFKRFGIDAAKFFAKRGTNFKVIFDKINIDHWESFTNPFTGKKKKVYVKRSYRYYMAVKKK
jgi:hypothetical protein